MQDAKLIKRLLLECSLRGARTKQDYRVLSHNFTDFFDLFPRLRKIMKRHPDEISQATKKPSAEESRSRDSFPAPP